MNYYIIIACELCFFLNIVLIILEVLPIKTVMGTEQQIYLKENICRSEIKMKRSKFLSDQAKYMKKEIQLIFQVEYLSPVCLQTHVHGFGKI